MKRITPLEFKALPFPLELRCGVCDHKGTYSVGRLYIDPTRIGKHEDWINEAFGFTGYVRCAHCNGGGPWNLTRTSKSAVLTLMDESLDSPKHARVHSAEVQLFDGTNVRWATEAEEHLKKLIDKDPDNYYLWSRLGNTYVSAEANDLALDVFREAVKRNEHDVESLHSIAIILQNRGENEAAARYYHDVLLHAKHKPEKTSRDLLRNMIGHTIQELSELHVKSGRKIPLLPEAFMPQPSAARSTLDPARIAVTQYDLSDENDLDKLIDWFTTGTPPERAAAGPAPKPRPASSWTPNWGRREPEHVGRNDPCPCGSGKKFKNCCMGK